MAFGGILWMAQTIRMAWGPPPPISLVAIIVAAIPLLVKMLDTRSTRIDQAKAK